MFVVCGRNVALGVYASVAAARAAIVREGGLRDPLAAAPSDDFSEWYIPSHASPTGRMELLTIVRLTQTSPHESAERLVR